jgi:hypothetical protein
MAEAGHTSKISRHITKLLIVKTSVVDLHHFDADPDSTYHPDADSEFLIEADPDAGPDPDPSFKKRLKPLKNC